jgi:MFS family permease
MSRSRPSSADLHLSTRGLEWIVSSYLLVLAGLLLVGGRLADLYGRRRVFLIGLSCSRCPR